MTEAAFQECRKIMQRANYLRGLITKAEGNVAKWTKIEDVHRRELREGQAEGARKCVEKAMAKLIELRDKFAAMKLPDSDMHPEKIDYHQCEACGEKTPINKTYCTGCLKEE